MNRKDNTLRPGKLSMNILLSLILALFLISPGLATDMISDFIVAADGSGDFTTIQQAIDRVPAGNIERVIIYIKTGIYREKIFIEKDCISLIGENRDNTRIEFDILRRDFLENHPDDWGAAVINIRANDFIMKNITVQNTYGLVHDDHDHQFTVRLMKGTRVVFDNCRILSGGGDTVSLWDKNEGMYYHRKCEFQGYVDFVCPRGWCYITGSRFYESRKSASLWHDGGMNKTQKFVVCNSMFDGVKDFRLGRRHFDAQFFLLNCTFSENMADTAIYRVTYPDDPSRDAPNNWGDRYYFFNCRRTGGDFDWHQNNLSDAPINIEPQDITAAWTFDQRWDPESTDSIRPDSVLIQKDVVVFIFKENVTVKGQPVLVLKSGLRGNYEKNGNSKRIIFRFKKQIPEEDAPHLLSGNNYMIVASEASLALRYVNLF